MWKLDAIRISCILPALVAAAWGAPPFGLVGVVLGAILGVHLWCFVRVTRFRALIFLAGWAVLTVPLAALFEKSRRLGMLARMQHRPNFKPANLERDLASYATEDAIATAMLVGVTLLFVTGALMAVRHWSRRRTVEDADRLLEGFGLLTFAFAVYLYGIGDGFGKVGFMEKDHGPSIIFFATDHLSEVPGWLRTIGIELAILATVCFALGAVRIRARAAFLARVRRGELPRWTIWRGIMLPDVAAPLPTIRRAFAPYEWLCFVPEPGARPLAVASLGPRP